MGSGLGLGALPSSWLSVESSWTMSTMGIPRCCSGKESVCSPKDTRDSSLIPGSGRSPGGEHGNPLRGKFHVWKIPWTEEPGRLQSMELQ